MTVQDESLEPVNRFSRRADYYVRYRPRYPHAIIPFLEEAIGLSSKMIVADIGSGTGFLSELFLHNGNEVFAVEPNQAMRTAAEASFADYEGFNSVAATAEETLLPNSSIDLVAVGQAFHWFDVQRARREFQRILRPSGWVILVYNSWNLPDSPVAAAYRALVDRYGIDDARARSQNRIDSDLFRFFGKAEPGKKQFENPQVYDHEALQGRILSSSYAPLPGHPNHEPMRQGIRQLFERFAEDGRLVFPYRTTVYWGKLS